MRNRLTILHKLQNQRCFEKLKSWSNEFNSDSGKWGILARYISLDYRLSFRDNNGHAAPLGHGSTTSPPPPLRSVLHAAPQGCIPNRLIAGDRFDYSHNRPSPFLVIVNYSPLISSIGGRTERDSSSSDFLLLAWRDGPFSRGEGRMEGQREKFFRALPSVQFDIVSRT